MKNLKSMDRRSLYLLIAGILTLLFLFSLLVSLPQNTPSQPLPFWMVAVIKAGFYLPAALIFFILAIFDGRKERKKKTES